MPRRPRRSRPRRSTPGPLERGRAPRRGRARRAPAKPTPAGMRPATRSASVTVGSVAAAAVAGRARARRRAAGARRQRAARRRRRRSSRRRRRWCGRRATAAGPGSPPTARSAAGSGTPSEHEAHVGARAAHVEGDGVGEARWRRRTAAAARTPPAGPDSSRPAGSSAASATGDQPAGRGHHQHLVGQRRQRRAGRRGTPGRRSAFTTVVTVRSYSRNSGDTSCEQRHVVALGSQRRGHRALVGRRRGRACRRQTATAARPRRAPPGPSPTGSSSLPSAASRPATSKRQARVHERRRPVGQRVVERRAVLAGDLDDVGEALGRDQRRRGHRPFEQGVGGHVVPWASSRPGAPARRRSRPGPPRWGRPGSTAPSPPAPSSTRSVNVPPVSDPIRIAAECTRRQASVPAADRHP